MKVRIQIVSMGLLLQVMASSYCMDNQVLSEGITAQVEYETSLCLELLNTVCTRNFERMKQVLDTARLTKKIITDFMPLLIDACPSSRSIQARKTYEECVQLLIERYPDDIKTLRFNVEHSVVNDGKELKGATALHMFACKDLLASVMLLIERKVFALEVLDAKGWTALLYSLKSGATQVAEYLHPQGARVLADIGNNCVWRRNQL